LSIRSDSTCVAFGAYNWKDADAHSLKRLIASFAMKTVVTTAAVDIALRTLDPDGVRRVHAWIDHLRNWDGDETVRKNSLALEGMPGVYVLRTTTDIRIFFKIEGDVITILDVAKKQAILTSGDVVGVG
jgi:hypothetical protein